MESGRHTGGIRYLVRRARLDNALKDTAGIFCCAAFLLAPGLADAKEEIKSAAPVLSEERELDLDRPVSETMEEEMLLSVKRAEAEKAAQIEREKNKKELADAGETEGIDAADRAVERVMNTAEKKDISKNPMDKYSGFANGVQRTAPQNNFSLHVKDAPVSEVLRNLAEITHKNLVFSGAISGTVTASLDNVTPDEALSAVLASSGLAARREGSTLIVFSGKINKDAGRSLESYRLSYANAKEVAEGLKSVTDEDHVAWNQSSNTVIVSGTPLEQLQAASVIRAIDHPEKQVKVEAEVIAVNRSHSKELGIDWDFKSLTGSATYSRDSWTEQHYVTDDSGNIVYNSSGYPRIQSIDHSGWEVTAPEGYAGISYGRSVTGHPYTFFFQAKLNALISQGKARVLAKPNVVTMNGRKAEILIGNKIPVIVEHLQNGQLTQTTEYRDAGIKLSYTPIISEDDEITASVTAEVSTPYLVSEMKAYRIVTRQANTMVRLRSGDMLTIGGLIDKEESKTFRKIPILGDIPILGKLFQSKSTSVEESEIVIIIRAEILGQ